MRCKREKAKMVAWESTTSEKPSRGEPDSNTSAGIVYQLIVAFPSLGGILLALYVIILTRLGILRFHSR